MDETGEKRRNKRNAVKYKVLLILVDNFLAYILMCPFDRLLGVDIHGWQEVCGQLMGAVARRNAIQSPLGK